MLTKEAFIYLKYSKKLLYCEMLWEVKITIFILIYL